MMKVLFLSVCMFAGLKAGLFETDTHEKASQRMGLLKQFKENASDASAITKRGEYALIKGQEQSLARIRAEVLTLGLPEQERTALLSDLDTYKETVRGIGTQLQKSAPELHQHYRRLLDGLGEFNRRLGSIGLRELLHGWRELSRVKGRFVKEPDARLAKTFDTAWTEVSVTISELYLDEEMEAPLLEYLDAYKAYFEEVKHAYKAVGYADVSSLKPLTYKIKMQMEMMAPRLAERH
ncbi:hypothetical protein LOH54_10745 [Sulfurimonas sp. HSL-3221]|uniref:hypothetical protein n=1 Tax=Sulfurimonadaceae TaxID=2771471 RepID=UPI001E605615|nr:hypothetical protein [Sulfurimonas sp. HSL-3221]UFS62125.1 hypothetical protein LOH54_10745 [Sulfurimonas sp. HSL-3221]